MFIDSNSKKLIKYLSETEPSVNIRGYMYYPVPSLANAIGKLQEENNDDVILPYLEKLKSDGYIIEYNFVGVSNVRITRAVQLEFWEEYNRHEFLHSILIPALVSFLVSIIVIIVEMILK